MITDLLICSLLLLYSPPISSLTKQICHYNCQSPHYHSITSRPLMKNLLLGYFHAPENKRPEVIRVLGNLVGFSQDEINEVFHCFTFGPCANAFLETFLFF